MTAPAPIVTPELKQVLRRLKLGKMLDTLPERLVLAKQNKLGHAAFLELVLADEIDRRDRTGATQRARTAGLDPTMTLETWDDHDAISYDHDMLAELATLRSCLTSAARVSIEVSSAGNGQLGDDCVWAGIGGRGADGASALYL
jgi:hypothetical protein